MLVLYVFFLPFMATAVWNSESITFGLQPSYLMMFILAGHCAVSCMLSNRNLWRFLAVLKYSFPVLLLVAIALVSNATLYVAGPQRGWVMSPEGELTSLEFTRINVTQSLYLCFMYVSTVVVAWHMVDDRARLRTVKALFLSALFVCAWGFLQVFGGSLGIAYPTIFNNRVGVIQFYEQLSTYTGTVRMSSVAVEPSTFAHFLILPFVTALFFFHRGRAPLSQTSVLLVLLVVSLSLLLTTSTTGWLTLGGTFAMLFAFTRLSAPRSIGVAGVAVVVVVLSEFVGRLFIEGGFIENGIARLQDVLNLDIRSAEVRLRAFEDAIYIFQEHWLLGIGYGTGRSTDLLSNTLMGMGILGLAALVYTVWYYVRALDLSHFPADEHAGLVQPFRMALLVSMGVALCTNPDLNMLHVWLPVSMLISLRVYGVEARQPEPVGTPVPTVCAEVLS